MHSVIIKHAYLVYELLKTRRQFWSKKGKDDK